MPIPTLQDHAIGEIDDLADNIRALVRVMQRANPKDRAGPRKRLCEMLESCVSAVVNAAPK
jgi:hypothetical protein